MFQAIQSGNMAMQDAMYIAQGARCHEANTVCKTATHILVKHIIKDFSFPVALLQIYMCGRILRSAHFLESVVLHLSRQSLTAE